MSETDPALFTTDPSQATHALPRTSEAAERWIQQEHLTFSLSGAAVEVRNAGMCF